MEFYVLLVLLGAAFVFADAEGHMPPRCPPVDCEPPCQINESNLPCPSCECIQCSLPLCPPPCWINFTTVPCASCQCEGADAIQCTLPKCSRGCVIDLDTQPCPSCSCDL
ncbi:hypothetical protein HNY73_016885 [Argiope bruennichi]|uniref:Uncharacterized protein n=1 Tax=Argiope bruennichi TaxID=94029 RepID=A0A8T0ELE0_ARGBR|nr:hypothetical protein HNY73_016885 [Argiope bruennichi]